MEVLKHDLPLKGTEFFRSTDVSILNGWMDEGFTSLLIMITIRVIYNFNNVGIRDVFKQTFFNSIIEKYLSDASIHRYPSYPSFLS